MPEAAAGGAQARARARDLKDGCYAAWHSDPAEALRCAAALRALADAAADPATELATDADVQAEITALADWTGAVADLINGELARALQRLEAARAGFAALGQAADAAQTQVPCIMALALLGRFDEAAACALRTRDALLTLGDARSAAKVVLNLGSLCMQQDRYAEGAAHYRQAAVLFARIGDREHSVLADVGSADALSYLGDLDAAEALYRRAQQRAQAHGLPVIVSAVVQALAEVALARGRYPQALRGLEAASREFARLNLPLQRLEAEKALADAYLELHLWPEAEALYAQVQAGLAGHERAATRAWVLLQQARLATRRGASEDAHDRLARAQAQFAAMDNAAGLAALQLARAGLWRSAGDAAAARAAAAAALQGLQALDLPPAEARLALAEADADLGELQGALAGFAAVLAAPAVPLPLAERAWLGRGQVLLRQGERGPARLAFEQAAAHAEAGRAGLPGDDFQRAFLQARSGAHEALLRLALADHDRAPVAAREATAWVALRAAERLRARTLRERLGPAAHTAPAALAEEALAPLRQRLDWLYRRLNRFLHDGEPEEAPEALQLERQRLEQALLEALRRQRLGGSAAGGGGVDVAAGQGGAGREPATAEAAARADRDAGFAPGGAAPAALAALHDTLGAGRALIVFGQQDDELFAFTVVGGRLQLHRGLAPMSEVLGLVRTWRGLLDTQRLGAQRLQRHAAQLAGRMQRCLGALHARVWAPLAARVDGCDAVQIVPSGALATLPWAALWDGRQHLVQRHRIALLASVDALRPLAVPPPASGLAPSPGATRAEAAPAVTGPVVALADTLRLPGAADEARALAACWPDATVLCGSEVTRAALRRLAPQAGLLHLACHGEFRADSPLFSALHLHDGALTALEAEGLGLRGAPLVVLSACETALADDARGDEALGLVRAFLIAGAGAVLGGLWALDDAATARWMARWHAALAQGQGPAQALRTAQCAALAAGDTPDHWAAFALHGQA